MEPPLSFGSQKGVQGAGFVGGGGGFAFKRGDRYSEPVGTNVDYHSRVRYATVLKPAGKHTPMRDA